MLVVLDTNVLHDDYLFANTRLSVILKESADLGFTVAISEVTLREHAKHYSVEKRQLLRGLWKLDGGNRQEELDGESVVEEFRRRATKVGITVLPLPAISHLEILRRACSGIRPFTEDGRLGYGDALIWESIKFAAENTEVVIVSNDGDFGKHGLDVALKTESAGSPHPISKLRGFDAFLSEYVNPRRQELDQLRRDLVDGKISTIGIAAGATGTFKSATHAGSRLCLDYRFSWQHCSRAAPTQATRKSQCAFGARQRGNWHRVGAGNPGLIRVIVVASAFGLHPSYNDSFSKTDNRKEAKWNTPCRLCRMLWMRSLRIFPRKRWNITTANIIKPM